MPTPIQRVTVFIGGPHDTTEDRQAVGSLIENTLARRENYRKSLDLRVKFFDHPRDPVGVGYGEDWQERIDQYVKSADVVIMLFRWKLGEPRPYHGKDYPSMSVYELEQSLAQAHPKLAVFRYSVPFSPSFPQDLLNREATEQIEFLRQQREEGEEYQRLDTYFNQLRETHPALPVPTFSSPENLLGLAENYLTNYLDDFITHSAPASFESEPKVHPPGWPFQSFESLTDEDHDIFFGRETEVREILGRLADPQVRFLCIRGLSGTGKSSLLKAGILPPLLHRDLADRYGFPYRRGTMRLIFTPGDRPFERLFEAASHLQGTSLYSRSTGVRATSVFNACRKEIDAAKKAVAEYLATPALQGASADAELLIVVDQAEDLWIHCADEDRNAFLMFVVAAVETPRLRVFMTVRGEFFTDLPNLMAALLNGPRSCFWNLEVPDSGRLETMIAGPLGVAGLKMQPGLLGTILHDAEQIGVGASLPLVAHTLHVLAKNSTNSRLTVDAYRAMNGLQGAVQATVERAGPIPKDVLPPLFDLLYDTHAGTPVRRVVSWDEVNAKGEETVDVVHRLVDARIISGGVPFGRTGTVPRNIQLAHDALFESWGALRDWIRDHRRDLEIRDELLRDAERWERHGQRRRHIRLRPEALEEIQELDREKPYLFGRAPVIGRYLNAADALHQRELLVAHLTGGHLAAAMDAFRRGARLGKEDRGTEPNQLREAFHAAVTGDDRVTEDLFAPQTSQAPNEARRSVFDDADNIHPVLSRGLEPIALAALFGHLHLVKKLIAMGASPDHRSLKGLPLIGIAAFGGHLNVVRYLVEDHGIDADRPDGDGSTPLIWALNQGHNDVTSYLLAQRANLYRVSNDGWNALTEAVRGASLPLVELVLGDSHFEVNGQTPSGISALCVACQKVNPDYIPIATRLLDHGASVNGGAEGWRPVALAAAQGFHEMVQLLLERGADPNLANPNAFVSLHSAAARGSATTVRLLLASSAHPDQLDPTGDTPLSIAAKDGRDEIVELLLIGGANPDRKSGDAWTALQYAADDGDIVIAELLLRFNADVNLPTPDLWTPLHLSARKGNEVLVQMFLAKAANVEARINRGSTPLHLACARDHEGVARLLLEHHADVNARDNDQLTPLHEAARLNHGGVARLLLDWGAGIDSRDLKECTPLHFAAATGQKAVAGLLLDRGASLQACDADQWAPLHFAAANGHEAVAGLLLDRGADIEARDSKDQTPLQRAATNGRDAVARLLLDRGAAVESRDVAQRTPLHFAAANSRESMIGLLLDRGSAVEPRDANQNTPLHYAAAIGHEAAAALLLDRGADIEARDVSQWTPLLFAADSGRDAAAKLLLDRGADINARDDKGQTPLHRAAANDHEAVVRLLLGHRADIEGRDANQRTPIYFAAANGCASAATLLLDRGAAVEPRDKNQITPLHFAAAMGHESVATLLLDRGAEIAARDADQWTPLHAAADNGHEAPARLLLDRGADMNARDDKGQTPLHFAAANGHEAVVQLLLDRHAEINAVDAENHTALYLAAAGGHEKVIKLLRESGAAVDPEIESLLAAKRAKTASEPA